MIHAAIFDMDGLLFDTERLCCRVWTEVSAAAGYQMDERLFMSCVGRNSRDTRDLVISSLGHNFPYDALTKKVEERLIEIMNHDGPPRKPGATELLNNLHQARIPFALATSTSQQSATWMLQKAGFLSFFSALAFGNEVIKGKPSPDIFFLAAKRLSEACNRDLYPSNIAVFEDSPAGIRGARKAGMLPVLVPDMVFPDADVRSMAWKEIKSLEQAFDLFEGTPKNNLVFSGALE